MYRKECPSLLLILYETASLQVILCTWLVGNLIVNQQLAITNLPYDWWAGQWKLFPSFFSSNYFLWQSKKSSIYRCVCSELPDSGKLQLFGRRLLFSLWGKFAGVTTARLLSDKRSVRHMTWLPFSAASLLQPHISKDQGLHRNTKIFKDTFQKIKETQIWKIGGPSLWTSLLWET